MIEYETFEYQVCIIGRDARYPDWRIVKIPLWPGDGEFRYMYVGTQPRTRSLFVTTDINEVAQRTGSKILFPENNA